MKFLLAFILVIVSATLGFAQDPSETCLNRIQTDPNLQELYKNMPYDISKGQSIEILANNSKLSPEDKIALSFFALEGEKCFNLGAEWRSKNYPIQIISLMETYKVDLLSILADLYGGTATYGETAKKRAKVSVDFRNRIQEITEELKARKQESEAKRRAAANDIATKAKAQAQANALRQQQLEQQENIARRNAALQILGNMAMQPPIPMQPIQMPQVQPYKVPTPKQTNCNMSGNQMNCTTY